MRSFSRFFLLQTIFVGRLLVNVLYFVVLNETLNRLHVFSVYLRIFIIIITRSDGHMILLLFSSISNEIKRRIGLI